MLRYARLLALSVRVSLSVGLQYRWNFVLNGLVALAWTAAGVLPLEIALRGRPAVAGWTFERALVVTGFFTLLRGVLEGAVTPSLLGVVEHIRQGTLDFVLLKPADAQFLVSTTKFDPWKGVDVLAGLALMTWAFRLLHQVPTAGGVALAVLMLAAALLVLYSLWILVIAMAFWVVRLDNLAFFWSAIFDFARWPVGIFKGATRVLFTFVIPIGLMTTYPAQALLGDLDAVTAGASMAGAIVFAALARVVWGRALRHYTSASS